MGSIDVATKPLIPVNGKANCSKNGLQNTFHIYSLPPYYCKRVGLLIANKVHLAGIDLTIIKLR